MRIFLDENLSEHLATALNYLNKGYFPGVEVSSTITAFRRGAKDEEIIPQIGAMGGILITRDEEFKKARIDMCRKHGVGVVVICPTKGKDTHWDMVMLLIKHWQDIINKYPHSPEKPLALKITHRGGLKTL